MAFKSDSLPKRRYMISTEEGFKILQIKEEFEEPVTLYLV